MPQEKTHDLHDFMKQLQDKMAANYKQIQKRASEDPGTAGDQGEENWRDLLSGWLPRTYEVVTRGRIIGQDGRTSPQVDVLVLKSIYPEKLLNKKLYLAAGVAAAFECKTTLTAEHIEQAVKTCAEIKNLYPAQKGTPYKELNAPIVYGLLAHSHPWKSKKATPEKNIERMLLKSDKEYVSHPRECLDVLCVADFGTWISGKLAFIYPPPSSVSGGPSINQMSDFQYVLEGSAQTTYVRHTPFHDKQTKNFTPIGTLISNLSRRLAWEDVALRDLVDYYQITKIGGAGMGGFRYWPISIYSQDVEHRIKRCGLSENIMTWDEWQIAYNL